MTRAPSTETGDQMRKGDMNYYCKWAYFRGYIVTCNDDGSIPLNALVVMDLSIIANDKIEEEAQRVIAMHNELLHKSRFEKYEPVNA